MTDFHIKVKVYKPIQKKINTYQEIPEPKKTKSEYRKFIERRLRKMGLMPIK